MEMLTFLIITFVGVCIIIGCKLLTAAVTVIFSFVKPVIVFVLLMGMIFCVSSM